MSDLIYPRQSPTTHTEQLGDEASVYDWVRAQVHALNPTAARVWRQCDGATSPAAIAAALRREMGIPEADAVVDLTLKQLARVHLLELPVESRGDRPAMTRRWLLGRGVAAAMLPAIYSIVAPSPVDAQTPGAPPTLASITPPSGDPGSTIVVALTGTGFGTTVAVSGTGVVPSDLHEISSTSLQVTFTVDAGAAPGPRNVTVTTPGGTSKPLPFTVNSPAAGAPTLTSVSPNQGIRGTTVDVTLTGTNFVVGATAVTVASGGITVTDVSVSSGTSLTAKFELDLADDGLRLVTVTTAGGTSGPGTFLIRLPLPGRETFNYTGTERTFIVPDGVVSILIEALAARGGAGSPFGEQGNGGRAVARVSVTPGTVLTVRVGGEGQAGAAGSSAAGGFNGGGGTTGDLGGGGGGATSVHDGATPLVIAGGGGGSGSKASGGGGNGGDGGGTTARDGELNPVGGRPGGGGTQFLGGAGGTGGGSVTATDGMAGSIAGTGGMGGSNTPGVLGGGGGGGGYRGGGGGGGGTPGSGGGGGGSSFTAPGATNVVHQQGVGTVGQIIISW